MLEADIEAWLVAYLTERSAQHSAVVSNRRQTSSGAWEIVVRWNGSARTGLVTTEASVQVTVLAPDTETLGWDVSRLARLVKVWLSEASLSTVTGPEGNPITSIRALTGPIRVAETPRAERLITARFTTQLGLSQPETQNL